MDIIIRNLSGAEVNDLFYKIRNCLLMDYINNKLLEVISYIQLNLIVLFLCPEKCYES